MTLLLLAKQKEYEPQPLILPGNPLFHYTLGTTLPPVEDRNCNYVFHKDSMVMEAVNDRQLDDYLEGGEYDEIEADAGSDILYLPYSIDFE